MYGKIAPITLKGSASSLFNNLDILPRSSKGSKAQASFLVVHKHDVHITNQLNANFTHKQVSTKDKGTQQNNFVFNAKWCRLEQQTVLVTTHSRGFQIYDEPGNLLLFWHSTLDRGVLSDQKDAFCRGIAAISDYILIGTCHGKIIIVETLDLNTFAVAHTYKAHQHPVITIATKKHSSMDGTVNVASADDEGAIFLWEMEEKLTFFGQIPGPSSKYPCTAICFLNDDLLGVSYYTGRIRLFNMKTLKIAVEIAAHAAPIMSMDSVVNSDFSMLISGSEDSFVRVWRIEKTGKLQVSQIWYTSIKDRLICGVKFHGTDDVFGVTGYDSSEIAMFRKK